MYEWKGTPAYNVTVPVKDGDDIGYALSSEFLLITCKSLLEALL